MTIISPRDTPQNVWWVCTHGSSKPLHYSRPEFHRILTPCPRPVTETQRYICTQFKTNKLENLIKNNHDTSHIANIGEFQLTIVSMALSLSWPTLVETSVYLHGLFNTSYFVIHVCRMSCGRRTRWGCSNWPQDQMSLQWSLLMTMWLMSSPRWWRQIQK